MTDRDEQTPAIAGWYMEGPLSITVRDRSRHKAPEQSKGSGRDG
jgi:hypothetical protein